MERNKPFFAAHETYFLTVKEEYGEDAALDIMRSVMQRSLGAAYRSMDFEKGKPKEFVRVVSERDRSVGLRVEFPDVSDSSIVYQFHDDPFPGLCGRVDAAKLDATYMDFKVLFLLGGGWSYRTTKHLWNDDPFTEHVIERK